MTTGDSTHIDTDARSEDGGLVFVVEFQVQWELLGLHKVEEGL